MIKFMRRLLHKQKQLYHFHSRNCGKLKAKKTHGFNSCIMISVYPLAILSIKKGTEYCIN